jgi:hypothetical protein
MLGKIIDFAALGVSVTDKVLLNRFLGTIVELVALTIISAMAIGILLAGSFYGIYVWLTHYGLDTNTALLSTLGFGFLLTALLVSLTIWRLRKAREVSLPVIHHHLVSQVGHVATAFLAGFKKLY